MSATEELQVANKAGEAKPRFEVSVIYNGVIKTVEANINEAIQALLQRAIHAFGSLPSPHTLALYDDAGRELDDKLQVGEAGGPKAHLLLRPSQVKGGTK